MINYKLSGTDPLDGISVYDAGSIKLTDYTLFRDNPDNAFGVKLGMTVSEAKEQLLRMVLQ